MHTKLFKVSLQLDSKEDICGSPETVHSMSVWQKTNNLYFKYHKVTCL
jgi:hypothetical protein